MADDSQTLRRLLAEKDALVEQLLERIARLENELAAANANTKALSTQIGELASAVAKGNERIAELLAIVQRKKAPPKSKPKDPAAPPDVDDDERTAFENRPKPPDPPGKLHNHPKPRPCPTGRKPLPKHLPADESTVHPDCCAGCGDTDFVWKDEVVEEKLDVAAHQRRRVTHRKTGRCRSCGTRTTAEAPPSPFPRSKVTCAWLAWLVVQKFRLNVPLDRIRLYLGAQGIALSESFLVSQIERAADLVAPVDGEHWKQLLAGTWLATDGTNLKVQVPGHGLHHGFLEVYQRTDAPVVFQYEPEKGGETQAGKLGRFKGALLVDAESRYNETLRAHAGIRRCLCNAHPRRKLRDAEKERPALAAEGGRFVSAMFDREAEARERRLVGANLLEWRKRRIGPLVEAFRRWRDAVLPVLLPDEALAKVLRYYKKHWTELFRFVSDPAVVPMDNSGSERQFQPVAKLRLNSLFAGSTEGAYRAAVLLGIVHTCKRLDVDPEAYLTWLFERRGTHSHKYDLAADELTPEAFKAQLPAD